MAQGSTRGVQAGMVILTVSASIFAGAGFYVGGQGGTTWPWFAAAIACVGLAALLPIVFWVILPRIAGERPEAESNPVRIQRPSGGRIEANVPKDSDREVHIEDPSDTDIQINIVREELQQPPERDKDDDQKG